MGREDGLSARGRPTGTSTLASYGTRKGTRCSQRSDSKPWVSWSADMFFVDPTPNEGQETPERGVRLELRLVDRAEPQGSIYAGVPISFTRPVWRVDLFGSTESPPGTLDRAHHHPRFNGWEPGAGTSSPNCQPTRCPGWPVSWPTRTPCWPVPVSTRTKSAAPIRPDSPRLALRLSRR